MPENNFPVIKKHKLSHIPQLKVDPNIFEPKFVADCAMYNCNATCCQHGVMVDLEERENILTHAELIQKYMEPHQDKNPDGWFDKEEEFDLDYPSGRVVGTQTRDYGCVFLDSSGRCVLQKAAMGEGMSKFALKPFFCFAFPITIEQGVLTVDDLDFINRVECCALVEHGSLSAMEVCAEELEFVVGKEGFKEMQEISNKNM